MKRNPLVIGLLCVVAGGACLLAVHYHAASMSDRSPASIVVVQTATSTSLTVATSTVSEPASTTLSQNIAAAAVVATTPKLAPMSFEVVTTQAAQEQGLGGRAVIPDNYAMLFVFPSDGTPGFWMKDMLTSIDMIWLTDNGTIAGIQEDATAASYPDVFYPPYPIRYVLETRVGLAKERGWTIGTRVALPLPYGK